MAVEIIMINLQESVGPGRDLDLLSNTYLQPDTLPTVLRSPVHLIGDFTYNVISTKAI